MDEALVHNLIPIEEKYIVNHGRLKNVANCQMNPSNCLLSDCTKNFHNKVLPVSPSDKVDVVNDDSDRNCQKNDLEKYNIDDKSTNQNLESVSKNKPLTNCGQTCSYKNNFQLKKSSKMHSKMCSFKSSSSKESHNTPYLNSIHLPSIQMLISSNTNPLSWNVSDILSKVRLNCATVVENLLMFLSKKSSSRRKMHIALGRSWTFILIVMTVASWLVQFASGKLLEDPHFGRAIVNVTAAVGREAILECVAEQLGNYKVAWLRVDTQTILTIHSHVITKNHRIGVTHSEHRTWYLHIKEVKESDRGWYMCQINTDPMKSQVGYLDVVVPPDILDIETSTDLVVQEGANVSLRCAARGSPIPTIMWKRENSETIRIGTRKEVISTMGSVLHISRVSRQQMGPYLCIASNGVPPSVSKRIMLVVHFPPIIWIQYQLIGAYDGQQIVLECNSEAYPKSINYWTGDKGQIIPHNEKFEPILMRDAYRVHMQLIIRDLQSADYGIYKCISKNSLGETDGTINVYRIPKPSTYNITKTKNGARSRLITEDEKYQTADYQTDNPDSQHLDVGNRSNLVAIPRSGLLLSVLSLPSVLITLLAT